MPSTVVECVRGAACGACVHIAEHWVTLVSRGTAVQVGGPSVGSGLGQPKQAIMISCRFVQKIISSYKKEI